MSDITRLSAPAHHVVGQQQFKQAFNRRPSACCVPCMYAMHQAVKRAA
jgi:hypothetical protein